MNTLYLLQMINQRSKLKVCDNYEYLDYSFFSDYLLRMKILYVTIFKVGFYSNIENTFHRKYENV